MSTRRIDVQDLAAYLGHTKEQARLHGRAALQAFNIPQEFRVGFESPDVTVTLSINALRGAFPCDWREDTELAATYRRLGGKTPISTVTRSRPNDEITRLYVQAVEKALQEGEAARCFPN